MSNHVPTGSAIEADNLALIGTSYDVPAERRHLIVSAVKHPSCTYRFSHKLCEKGSVRLWADRVATAVVEPFSGLAGE
jgi:cysteine sulfinate desulfinase/cysteine desulfurase-like protein